MWILCFKESLEDEIPVKLFSKHKDTQQAKEQSYSCSFYPKTFSNNSHLVRHIKTLVLIDSFACDDCGEKFSRKSNLQSQGFCVFPFSSVDLFKNLLPTVGNFKMGNH